MRKFRYTQLVLAAVFVSGTASGAATEAPAEIKAADVQACMQKNLVRKGALRDMKLHTTGRDGKSHALRLKLYWKPDAKGQARVNLRLLEPLALRGSSYLVTQKGRAEEVFFFLPSADRPLRITGENMDEPLWGTDFSYGEIKQVLGLAASGSSTLGDQDRFAGRPVHMLITEAPDDLGGYRKIVSAVDKSSCTLLRSEFFAKGDAPRKRLEADLSTLLDADGRWLILGYTMHNLQSGSRTEVALSDFSINERLPERLFDPKRFQEDLE